jgi:hypothetical protein
MAQLYDGDGNPIEAFTPEEVEKQLDQARKEGEEKVEEAKATAKEETQSEMEVLQKQITEKEEEMERLSKKDANFGALRKIKEDLETKLTTKEKEFDAKIEEIKALGAKEKVESLASVLAAGDTELKDKIVFHYNSFQGTPQNEEELKKQMENAFILATGSKPADISNLFPTSSGFVPKPPTDASGKGELSDAAKEVGQKMGITDEEEKRAKEQGLI